MSVNRLAPLPRDGPAQPDEGGFELGSERGFILVPVLLISLLIAAAAVAFIASSRASMLAQRNSALSISAEAIADGAVQLAVGNLQSDELIGSGATVFCRWEDAAVVAVAVQDQGGLIDLNTASPALMAAVIESLLEGSTQAVLQDINDFRDADRLAADGTIEPGTYPNRPFGPKNAPFASVYELDQVPSVDEGLLPELIALTTVHSQQPGIDLQVAPEALKQRLSEIVGADLSGFSSPSPRKTFALVATARLSTGTQFTRQVLLTLTQQPDNPVAIVEWRRSRAQIPAWPEPASLPSCFN
jgi:general secretion pathway protein K